MRYKQGSLTCLWNILLYEMLYKDYNQEIRGKQKHQIESGLAIASIFYSLLAHVWNYFQNSSTWASKVFASGKHNLYCCNLANIWTWMKNILISNMSWYFMESILKWSLERGTKNSSNFLFHMSCVVAIFA